MGLTKETRSGVTRDVESGRLFADRSPRSRSLSINRSSIDSFQVRNYDSSARRNVHFARHIWRNHINTRCVSDDLSRVYLGRRLLSIERPVVPSDRSFVVVFRLCNRAARGTKLASKFQVEPPFVIMINTRPFSSPICEFFTRAAEQDRSARSPGPRALAQCAIMTRPRSNFYLFGDMKFNGGLDAEARLLLFNYTCHRPTQQLVKCKSAAAAAVFPGLISVKIINQNHVSLGELGR